MTMDGWLVGSCAASLGKWTLLSALLLATGVSQAAAADKETRVFRVLVDNKRAGEYFLTISREDNGSVVVTGETDVKVSFLAFTYRYSYRGTEVWQDGRLQRLDSTSDDDGKRFSVNAQAEPKFLRVRVNGREYTTNTDVWTTTYWAQPDSKSHDQTVLLLDADTGKEIKAFLQFAGKSQIAVAGQPQVCNHYRLSGGVQVELWYDAQGRMVRQEAVESGHRTLIELVGMKR
jgi:hypothetical protein